MISRSDPARARADSDAGELDREDIVRVLSGDRDRFASLVRRHQARLYRHALGMVFDPDAAADLVQDAFVRAYENLEQCRDTGAFRTWIFRIVRNRCLDHLKEKRRSDVPLDAVAEAPVLGVEPAVDLDRWAMRSHLDHALAQLPDAQREAFLLKHVHDMSYEEMAELLDTSESALRMRVMRARELLRSLLKPVVSQGEP